MLEMLISLRRANGVGEIGGAVNGDKKVGDIVCIKPSPAVWGLMERKYFLIAYFDNSYLDATVNELSIYPYKRSITTAVEDKIRTDMLERCSYKIDITMFNGSPGLDPTVEAGAQAPNGMDALRLQDLIVDIPDPPNNKAVILDSGGKKAELSRRKISGIVEADKLVFMHSNVMWRHGLAPPDGATQVDITDLSGGIRQFPTVANLVGRGKSHVNNVEATYIIHGTNYELPGLVQECLRNGFVLLNPILGMTEEQVEQECASNNIQYQEETIEVEGETVTHDRVI